MSRTDDDDVLRDHRRRMQTDFALHEVHRLVVVQLQVDDAVLSERRYRVAGLRVEREHLIAGRDVDDTVVAAPIGPVRETAPRELARRGLAAGAFELLVHPEEFARRGIERDHGATRAGGHVDDAVDHQRRRLVVVLGPSAQLIGLEAPRDFELVEVVLGDLIERRVPRVPKIAAVGGPFAILRAVLSGGAPARREENTQTDDGDASHVGPLCLVLGAWSVPGPMSLSPSPWPVCSWSWTQGPGTKNGPVDL